VRVETRHNADVSLPQKLPRTVDDEFLALALDEVADAAIATAQSRGAEWVDLRVMSTHWRYLSTRDAVAESQGRAESLGVGVRVLIDGVWGFASEPGCSLEAGVIAATRAVEMSKVAAPLAAQRVTMSKSPTLGRRTWCSDYVIDPFEVADGELLELLSSRSQPLIGDQRFVDAYCNFAKEQKFYADGTGNRLTSQRVRTDGAYELTQVTDGEFVSLRTLCPPSQRGYEWMADEYPWTQELSEIGDLLDQKVRAPAVAPGRYNLVIDATNLWLTIHESIGHATELDRILGFEANYAGSSFIRPEDVGSMVYGSQLLNVTADRSAAYGLSTIPYDDEGVATGPFSIIEEGVLVGVQTDRSLGAESNACAYSDSFSSAPLSRMPNISMLAAKEGPELSGLLEEAGDGIYVKGDNSWSIDTQRNNFQFTAQQLWRIKDGRLDGMLRDGAYQSTTREFWRALDMVGGQSTYVLCGADNCGKGQPGQVAPVSHGAPAGLFRDINILNTKEEA
jgi:TldD protein